MANLLTLHSAECAAMRAGDTAPSLNPPRRPPPPLSKDPQVRDMLKIVFTRSVARGVGVGAGAAAAGSAESADEGSSDDDSEAEYEYAYEYVEEDAGGEGVMEDAQGRATGAKEGSS